MKKIESIIRNSKVDAVQDALLDLGVQGMTITEVNGRGDQKGTKTWYRGIDSTSAFVPRVKVETVVADDEAERVVDAIFQAAHTGEVGDGRILVLNLDSVTRIRTGEIELGSANLVADEDVSRFATSRRF